MILSPPWLFFEGMHRNTLPRLPEDFFQDSVLQFLTGAHPGLWAAEFYMLSFSSLCHLFNLQTEDYYTIKRYFVRDTGESNPGLNLGK